MAELKANKELFYADAAPFFEEGLLKEIYSSDRISICNLCNCAYVGFDYCKIKEGQYGMFLNPNAVIPVAEDNKRFFELVEMYADTASMVLNQKTFELAKKLKSKYDINGPSKDINFEMEEELMGKYKQR